MDQETKQKSPKDTKDSLQSESEFEYYEDTNSLRPMEITNTIKSKEGISAVLGPVEGFFTFFKGTVGMGIFFLPIGFSQSGWAFSLFAFFTSAMFSWEGMTRLAYTHAKYELSYPGLAKKAGGRFLKYFLELCIVINSITCVCSYSVFIILNINRISVAFNIEIPELAIAIALFLIIAPLLTVIDISAFCSLNIVADIITIAIILFVEIYALNILKTQGIHPSIVAFTDPWNCMRLFGMSAFAYELNAVLIPLYKQLKEKSDYAAVQGWTMGILSFFYVTLGMVGYLAFGSGVRGPVTISMNQSLWYVEIVESVYCIALFPTILIQIYPANIIILPPLTNHMAPGSTKNIVQNIIRISLFFIIVAIAYIFSEKFDIVVAIIGNFAATTISFIMPGIIHLVLVANTNFDKARDILLIIFGSICFVIGNALTIIGLF